MDGISGMEPIRGGVATDRVVSTTQNAIEEVKLVSTVLPAENGHSAGGLLSATYKSGTNQLHGELEERYVNNSFLHRQYFQLPRRTTPFTYHTPSALISGPIYLPKLYNGRNRTFFLFGYIRKHAKEDQPAFSTVPTPEQLDGDFSFNGLGFPIHDPASTAQDANGRWTRTPFPGNIVPKGRFDPVATKFLSFQPWNAANNQGGAGFIDRTGPHQNYGGFTKTRSYRTSFDVKIDHNFSEKNRMFGRYSHVRNRAQNGNQIALNWELLDGNWVQQPSDQFNSVISDTHIFSPHLISELRLGANHRKQSRTPGGLNENWGQKLGIPGISPATFPSLFDSAGASILRSLDAGRHLLPGHGELYVPGECDLHPSRTYFQGWLRTATHPGQHASGISGCGRLPFRRHRFSIYSQYGQFSNSTVPIVQQIVESTG